MDSGKLALFDLDNTLLAGDSDYLWGEFLVEQHRVDGDTYYQRNREFYEQYKQGALDIHEFLAFSLSPLATMSLAEIHALQTLFVETKVKPIVADKTAELLEAHRERGHTLVIITATNDVVTGPIAKLLGVEHLIATRAERTEDGYSGQPAGLPCFQEGKITRLDEWRQQQPQDFDETWFYSDSLNDIPLLEAVDHPCVVDADPTLEAHARAQGWPIMSLR